jgi:hypothetical protein
MFLINDATDVLVAVNVRPTSLIKNAVVVDTTFLVKLIAFLNVAVETLVATKVINSLAICPIDAMLVTAVAVRVLNKVNSLVIVAVELAFANKETTLVNARNIVAVLDTAVTVKVCRKDFVTIPEKDAEENGCLPNIRRLLHLHTGSKSLKHHK